MIPREVFEQTLLGFFEPVRAYLEDPSVSEVMINGPFEVWIERAGRLHRTEARFASHEALLAAIRNLAQYVGRTVDEERPILEARLPDGSRVEAILPPASPDGPSVAIRRFFRETLTIDRLIAFGSLTEDAAQLLRALVGCKQNILVAGGTGSGKTSLLNVLSSFVDDGERIVVIEDSRELQLQKPHVVQLEARPPDARGRGAVTIRDLFKATLRMRPDRIVVGEIRGGEALDLVQAMTSGHGGCLSTVHASYPIDAMSRLETMALMSDVGLPLHALRAQVGSAVDIIVQTARLQDGSRCVTHVTEVVGYHPERGYELVDLFVRTIRGRDARGRVISSFRPTGRLPRCVEQAQALGFELPASMVEAATR
ncbi:MAG: CpaF family protein [Myxococcota bacterium]|nr:CpaF family protein [Myxococcota bacterium]MDW8363776.1 CpaF family protein [Myxococcales bacterium]